MSEISLTIEDAARAFPALAERVHASGESALLTREGTPIVRIVPVTSSKQGAEDLIRFLREWRIAHPEPDHQFAEAIEESRRAIESPHDPWE